MNSQLLKAVIRQVKIVITSQRFQKLNVSTKFKDVIKCIRMCQDIFPPRYTPFSSMRIPNSNLLFLTWCIWNCLCCSRMSVCLVSEFTVTKEGKAGNREKCEVYLSAALPHHERTLMESRFERRCRITLQCPLALHCRRAISSQL